MQYVGDAVTTNVVYTPEALSP